MEKQTVILEVKFAYTIGSFGVLSKKKLETVEDCKEEAYLELSENLEDIYINEVVG